MEMKVKERGKLGFIGVLLLIAALLIVSSPPAVKAIGETGTQTLIAMQFILNGVQAQGKGVLQVGELNTLSAAVASATLTQVVAAPASGSIYLRAILVEKSTGGAGTVTLQSGTGVNCATAPTVLLGPITNPPVGYTRLEILVPAGSALCVQTDAATTGVRVLAQ